MSKDWDDDSNPTISEGSESDQEIIDVVEEVVETWEGRDKCRGWRSREERKKRSASSENDSEVNPGKSS